MFLINWIKDAVSATLFSLGLMNKKAKIIFLGLDDAGKTTLLNKLKNGTMRQIDPTLQPHSE
jgi:GTP-binding protein SAR1